MRVLVVEPEKRPEEREIDDSLRAVQGIVGGHMQAIYPFKEPVALVCNEKGQLMDFPPNRGLRDEHGQIYDIVFGTFFLCGAPENDHLISLTPEQIQEAGFDTYFVDHTTGVYPVAASGAPFNAATFSVTGDTIADLNEDLSAEQKARMAYDNILRFADDPDVRDPIKFLREREIVHFQRFGEGLRIVTDKLDSKNFYAFNPSFDKP